MNTTITITCPVDLEALMVLEAVKACNAGVPVTIEVRREGQAAPKATPTVTTTVRGMPRRPLISRALVGYVVSDRHIQVQPAQDRIRMYLLTHPMATKAAIQLYLEALTHARPGSMMKSVESSIAALRVRGIIRSVPLG